MHRTNPDAMTTRSRPRRPRRAALAAEPLEGRALLNGDLAMVGVSAVSPTTADVQYTVAGTGLPTIATLALYRSADLSFGPGDQPIGALDLSGPLLAAGAHDVTVTTLTQVVDPSHPYVVAVLDPQQAVAETDETNDAASYRIFVVGVVTHGVEYSGTFPAWVPDLANALSADGYDATVPFDWSKLALMPQPGVVDTAAASMVAQVNQAIAGLGVQPNDAVDLHLIGHSRGGGLVSRVAAMADNAFGPQVQHGFLKLTLLDPHPTHNGAVPYYSASTGPLGRLSERYFLAFQAAANDPPLTIPANVDQAEVFYQQTPATMAYQPDEVFVNSWGEVPALGAPAAYYNVTPVTLSHVGVYKFYRAVIAPTLGTASPVANTPAPAPPTGGGGLVANPGPNPAAVALAGTYREYNLLRASGTTPTAAVGLLQRAALVDQVLAANRLDLLPQATNQLSTYVVANRGRAIPTPVADQLLQLVLFSQILAGGKATA